ncbi:hypothetical protein [Tardiphaga sp. OK245]|uniref:hypothetical protein n=1 Tax=Tardiphaga sp. OK245 TaxID=1855306 RepID=UPI0008A75115|nr:hypothetical protein [Tardiphaga sp. OK245]SEI16876.1 hypothetical protein SAMN05216367_4461 [Tardiphaga sp. OK245]
MASNSRNVAGCFLVFPYPHEAQYPHDIGFQLEENVRGKIPVEQSRLKIEVERTLDVLRQIFSSDHSKFRGYFEEILALSRYGLVGPTAQPSQAIDTLRTLQSRILTSEKGAAISAHMRRVIVSQSKLLLGAILVLVVGVYLGFYFGSFAIQNFNILAVVPGLWVGLIFSSFLRCKALTFYELHAIDADRFSPFMKSAFALVVLVLIAILLKAGIFEVAVGKIRLSAFESDGMSALVLGVVVGLAQEAAISRIEAIKRHVSPTARPERNRRASETDLEP